MLHMDYREKCLDYITGCWFASVCNTESRNYLTQAKFTVANGNNYCLSVPQFTAYTWSAAQSVTTFNSVQIITRTFEFVLSSS